MNEPSLSVQAPAQDRGVDKPAAVVFRAGLCRRRRWTGRRADRSAAQLLFERGARLDRAASHRLSHDLQFSLDHQAGLRRAVGFRAAVRLSPQNLPHRRQHCRSRGLPLDHPTDGAEPAGVGPADHGLCHGDIEHRVRGGAGGERTKARGERQVRQSTMAVVQHRRHGRRDRRRSADSAPVAERGAARCRCHRRRRTGCGAVRHRLSDPREEGARRYCGAARHLRQSERPLAKNASCGSSGVFCFSITSVPA